MQHDEIVSFCQNDMASASFTIFEDMRTKNELCDVAIKVRNSTLVAHRVILAAGIPHFRSIFTSNGTESEEKEIAIGDIDPTVLESLIHFAYTGRVDISSENAHALLLASESLQLSQVADACIEFLSARLDVKNVAQVRTFALDYNKGKLIESTSVYIRNNFEAFYETDDFLHLSPSCFKEIISGDDLRISSEKTAFEAVTNWVKFSPSDRGNFLHELLSEVRMVHLPIGYLTGRVASEDLISASIPCRQLIQDVQSYHLLPEQECSLLKLKTHTRTGGYIINGLYAICLSSSRGWYSVYHCDFLRHTWNLLKSEKQNRGAVVAAAAVNDSIYLFLEKSTERFHLKILEWEVLKPTHENLAGAAISCHEDLIYFFGSYYPKFQSVRCFDTRINSWQKSGEMLTCRFCCAATLLQDTIYVTGGNISSLGSVATVEKYNPMTTQWSVRSPMLDARQCHGCVSLNGKIYVAGGRTAAQSVNTAEVFDSLINEWTFISYNLNLGGSRSFVTHASKIYAFRCKSTLRCHHPEIYDPEREQWVTAEFPSPCDLFSVVSISNRDK